MRRGCVDDDGRRIHRLGSLLVNREANLLVQAIDLVVGVALLRQDLAVGLHLADLDDGRLVVHFLGQCVHPLSSLFFTGLDDDRMAFQVARAAQVEHAQGHLRTGFDLAALQHAAGLPLHVGRHHFNVRASVETFSVVAGVTLPHAVDHALAGEVGGDLDVQRGNRIVGRTRQEAGVADQLQIVPTQAALGIVAVLADVGLEVRADVGSGLHVLELRLAVGVRRDDRGGPLVVAVKFLPAFLAASAKQAVADVVFVVALDAQDGVGLPASRQVGDLAATRMLGVVPRRVVGVATVFTAGGIDHGAVSRNRGGRHRHQHSLRQRRDRQGKLGGCTAQRGFSHQISFV
ncbi:hypothetical protein D3C72_1238890 [compost metagenome]